MFGAIHEFTQWPRKRGAVQAPPANMRASIDDRQVTGIISNRRSHHNIGQDLGIPDSPDIHLACPHGHSEIPAALAEFAQKGVNYLIINGGDGTVRDVLTSGNDVFGESWPDLAVLPKGKTNALNVDLGAPADWTLAQAITAFADAPRLCRRPLLIRPIGSSLDSNPADRQQGEQMDLLGFILGAGAYTLGVKAGQDAHRMGAFNSAAVAVTSIWGIAQALFGGNSNRWRKGTEMQIALHPDGAVVPHANPEEADRRMIFFASTLEKFPAGIKLFDTSQAGLRLMILDQPRRRLLGMAPMLMSGRVPQWTRKAGFRQIEAEGFDLKIGDPFILDGEAFPPGCYSITQGPELRFITV